MKKLYFNVVVGSWKAYSERNSRALGSKRLNLADFETLEDLLEELKREGFKNSELEETFIQDYESELDLDIGNCDYISIGKLRGYYEILKSADDLELLEALAEIFTFSELIKMIEDGSINNYYLTSHETAGDYAMEIVQDCYNLDNLGDLKYYIDFDAMGRDMKINGEIYETKKGVVVYA